MALEQATRELEAGLERLRSQISDHLLWVAAQSQPHTSGEALALPLPLTPAASRDHYLVGMIEDRVTEAATRSAEAQDAAAALAAARDPAAIARGLLRLQANLHDLLLFAAAELFSRERFEQLGQFGGEHGAAWEKWAENVIIELDRCQAALFEAQRLLLPCWREVIERLGPPARLGAALADPPWQPRGGVPRNIDETEE